MENDQGILSIVLFLSGILFAGLSLPLMKKKIKQNYFYGFRIKKAFSSEDNWYKINEYGGRLMFYWGIFVCAFAVFVIFLPLALFENYKIIFVLLPYAIMIPLFVMVFQFTKKL